MVRDDDPEDWRAKRKLVLLPALVHHWFDGNDLRLEDFVESDGSWRSADPRTDDLTVMQNYRESCVVWSVVYSWPLSHGICQFSNFTVPVMNNDKNDDGGDDENGGGGGGDGGESTGAGDETRLGGVTPIQEWVSGHRIGLTTFGQVEGDVEKFCKSEMTSTASADDLMNAFVRRVNLVEGTTNRRQTHACLISRGLPHVKLQFPSFTREFNWSASLVQTRDTLVRAMLKDGNAKTGGWGGGGGGGGGLYGKSVRRGDEGGGEEGGGATGTVTSDAVADDDGEDIPRIRVVHLRRTDKCVSSDGRKKAEDNARCGAWHAMPFLELCRRGAAMMLRHLPDATTLDEDLPVYVATEDKDPELLDGLSASGCYLPRDLDPRGHLSAAKAAALDYMLLETAVDAFTMGCSGWDSRSTVRRQVRGSSPLKMWVNHSRAFVEGGTHEGSCHLV